MTVERAAFIIAREWIDCRLPDWLLRDQAVYQALLTFTRVLADQVRQRKEVFLEARGTISQLPLSVYCPDPIEVLDQHHGIEREG